MTLTQALDAFTASVAKTTALGDAALASAEANSELTRVEIERAAEVRMKIEQEKA